jgi:hypothetical protein
MKEIVIDAFQCLETTHVVVGFGRLRRSKNKDDEIQIEVLLLEFRPDDPILPNPASVAPIRIWLGVGKLDLVYCGAFWCEGRYEGNYGDPWEAEVTFSDSVSFWEPRSTNELMLGDLRCFPFTWETQPRKAETKRKIRYAYVPMAELARAIFGVSSRMLIRMFGGIKPRSFAKKTYLYDRIRSRRIDANTVRLYCWSRPSDNEAIVAAASIVDDSLRKAHCSLFQTIQTTLRSEIYATTPFEMKKPFEKSVRMGFRALSIVRNSKYSDYREKLAKVEWIVIPTPFQKIEIKIESPLPDVGPFSSDIHSTVGTTKTFIIQDERAPNSCNASQQYSAQSSNVFTEHEIEIIELPRDKGGKPFPEFILDTVEHKLMEVSTGDPIPGAGKQISHLGIKRTTRKLTQAERKAWAEYEKEFKVIEAALKEAERAIEMGREKGLWSIFKMEVEEVDTPDGDSFLMLFAEILYTSTSRPILLADAGSCAGHTKAMGIICRKDGNSFSHADHASIRLLAGKHRGRWRTKMDPNDAPDLMINWVARNNVDGVDAHYKRLSGKLKKLFG